MKTEETYALETKNLIKVYQPPSGIRRALMRAPIQDKIRAVDNVNLQIKQGEIFGVLGPNGAGKTTLFKILTTLMRPTTGRAIVGGFDVVAEENKVKCLIGFVTGEERSFYWRLTGRQNLAFFAGLCNIRRSEIPERIDNVLQEVGLGKEANNMFYSFSSGMKQKLSIARALLTEPKVLFLDEPTRSVDVLAIAEIKQFIKRLASKNRQTVLLATHRLEEAEELCDRIAVMNKGRIIFCGTVDELRKALGSRERYEILAQDISHSRCFAIGEKYKLGNVETENPSENGLLKLSFTFTNGCNPLSGVLRDILTAGGTILSCNRSERSLEEMFVDLVKGDRIGS
ncbi:MAG: ABC transporter ATP-binding protein [Actinobacteria bacterium]|nr:ABC transporter ATP-binding protein [Actinomycetota bacterium]